MSGTRAKWPGPLPGERFPRYRPAKDGSELVEMLDKDDGEVIGTAVDAEHALLWASADKMAMELDGLYWASKLALDALVVAQSQSLGRLPRKCAQAAEAGLRRALASAERREA